MRLTVQFASGHKTKCDFFISLDRPSALRWSVERADVDVNAPYLGVPRQAVTLFRQRPSGTPGNVWAGRVDGHDSFGDRVRGQVAPEVVTYPR